MTTEDVSPSGLSRRQLVKRGGLIAGAAWTAPMVFDSFFSPAAAVSPPLGPGTTNFSTAGQTIVTVPAGKSVTYSVRGGGGGTGGDNTYDGGEALVVTGTIPAQGSPYDLTVYVGDGGKAGGGYNSGSGGAGGSGYRAGGAGGSSSTYGDGGGGGGASALTSTSPAMTVIAGGGGGTGGGQSGSTRGGSGGVFDPYGNANITDAGRAGQAGSAGDFNKGSTPGAGGSAGSAGGGAGTGVTGSGGTSNAAAGGGGGGGYGGGGGGGRSTGSAGGGGGGSGSAYANNVDAATVGRSNIHTAGNTTTGAGNDGPVGLVTLTRQA